MSVNRVNRGYSPIPFDRYEVIKSGLKPGEYVVMNQLPPQNALALINRHIITLETH